MREKVVVWLLRDYKPKVNIVPQGICAIKSTSFGWLSSWFSYFSFSYSTLRAYMCSTLTHQLRPAYLILCIAFLSRSKDIFLSKLGVIFMNWERFLLAIYTGWFAFPGMFLCNHASTWSVYIVRRNQIYWNQILRWVLKGLGAMNRILVEGISRRISYAIHSTSGNKCCYLFHLRLSYIY